MCRRGALCSYTPLIQSISRFTDSILSTSLSAVSLSHLAHFISISIFTFYLWTPFYLTHFILAL